MAFVFKFPDLGEGVHEGKIVKWLVKDGDSVKADQIIGEVETDKAIVELPCPSTGTMLKLYFAEGESVKVGQILLVIGNPGEAVPAQTGESQAGVSQAKVVPMPATQQHAVGVAGEKDHYTISGERSSVQSAAIPPSTDSVSSVHATPAVRNLAKQLGVDISSVTGTGPGGRITAGDVQAAKAGGGAVAAPAQQAAGTPAAGAQFSSPAAVSIPFAPSLSPSTLKLDGPAERVSMSSLRKAVARKMLESVSKAPQASHFDEADVTDLVSLREELKADAAAKGIHLTLLPFAAKAAIAGLKQFPQFNASLDESSSEIVLKKYYNLGIAVDTPGGLIVVSVKDADKLGGIYELASRINAMAERGRERKATVDELHGSTFTITNIGSIGGTGATPIINFPESAILGLLRMKEVPRVVGGFIVSRKVMPIAVTYDHRITDGSDAARFAAFIAAELQKPADYWRSQL